MSGLRDADPAQVLSMDDLASGRYRFAGTPLAVLGMPIKHSVSPPMHNAALAVMAQGDNRFQDWRYYRFEVHPDRLAEALTLLHRNGFRGINLTIPHKVEAVAIALVNQIDPSARSIGAVNTLLRTEDGFHGYNTDGYGMERAMKEELDVSVKDQQVVLLGAGGAGRAAAVQCLESGCRSLRIGNRNQHRLQDLLSLLEPLAGKDQGVSGFDITDRSQLAPLASAGLLINATSVGLRPDDDTPICLDAFNSSLRVFDMIYNPAITPLMKEANRFGMAAANGLGMLVWQGARALEIWSETEVPGHVMMRACKEALGLA